MIVGGVEQIMVSGRTSKYRWQGTTYSREAWLKYRGMTSKFLTRITTRKDAICYHGKTSDGKHFPMMLFREARELAPDPISVFSLRARLRNGDFLDVPLNSKEMSEQHGKYGVSEKAQANYKLGKSFATMPRPNGMNCETKEWVKPAW